MRNIQKLMIFLNLMCGICVASEAPFSIRVNANSQIDSKLWATYFQQCSDFENKYCEILINDGIKGGDTCNIKKECAFVGEIYYNAGDFDNAKILFKKSCEAGDMLGCFFLGMDFERNNDIFQAKEYYQKACDKKNMRACYKLGYFYEDGKAVRQDYKMAEALYKKACKKKEKYACYALGNLHESGNLAHDLSLAKEFYGKACDLNYQKGCDSYKTLNKSGIPSLYVKKNVLE